MTQVCVHAEGEQMTNTEGRELRAKTIGDRFAYADLVNEKLTDLKPELEALWADFDALAVGETIMGCSNRTEYCDRVLHRCMRAVQYAIYGREHVRVLSQEQALEETTNGIAVPPEVQNAQEYFPVKRPAPRKVEGEKSDVEKLRHLYEGVTSFKWKINTSNLGSGIASADKHYDLTLVGLTRDELKHRMELLA